METPPLAPLSKSVQRVAILGLIFFVWALAIALRLLQLQVFQHDKYRHLADIQQEKLDHIQAPRGAIFDRNGNYLAISSEVPIVTVNPLRMPDKDTAAGLLASVLHLDKQEIFSDLVSAAARHRGYLIVDSDASQAEVDAIRKLNLDWVDIRKGTARSYPNGQLAAHVIGNVNAEGVGIAGVERKLDKDLRGTAGLARITTDVHRQGYDSEIEKAPVVGKNVTLTIDSRLQFIAEREIAEAVTREHAERGSIVAMNPYTGDVLALANYPTYDLNEKMKPGSRFYGREDYAVVAPFEPGSVFKVVTLTAALETTNIRPSTLIDCGNGSIRIANRIVHDSHPHGILSAADVLAKSSNVGAIRIGMAVGNANLLKYIHLFGFGHRTGIELPAEAPGLVRPLSRWGPTSIGSVPMGQEVSVTSVQLAEAGSVIANGGFLVRPRVVLSEQEPGGQKIERARPKPVRVLKPQTAFTMHQLMERVTLPGGTGPRAHVLGYTTAGKTGTAQIFDTAHHLYTHRYNASFLGFAPVANPAIVVVVTVSGTTAFGATASGPAFKNVMSEALRLMGVPRDLPDEIKEPPDNKVQPKGQEDDLAIADAANPLTPEELQRALGDPSDDGAIQVVRAQNVVAPQAPDFIGKTIKGVMEEATAKGVQVDMKGRGLARAQRPEPGAALLPGEHVRVLFMR
ncbi:MAG TPA: penicillin-binding transpeptidase domain-containing protein [Bryobacteraceae bacterium]|nr:penicillin-binding transpeptidase domain-containing protein [Bryobacteraceae bacterium]